MYNVCQSVSIWQGLTPMHACAYLDSVGGFWLSFCIFTVESYCYSSASCFELPILSCFQLRFTIHWMAAHCIDIDTTKIGSVAVAMSRTNIPSRTYTLDRVMISLIDALNNLSSHKEVLQFHNIQQHISSDQKDWYILSIFNLHRIYSYTQIS